MIDDDLSAVLLSQPSCSVPGGDPSSVPGYLEFASATVPLSGPRDPRSMAADGGECTKGCSRSVCWLGHHFAHFLLPRFHQHRHRSAVSCGRHHAVRCVVLIGVRLALLCPNRGC